MAASVLGAAEIAYHAQSLPIFPLFGVTPPVLIPRTHLVAARTRRSAASPSSSRSPTRICCSRSSRRTPRAGAAGGRASRASPRRRRASSPRSPRSSRGSTPRCPERSRTRRRRSPTSSSSSPSAPARPPSGRATSTRTGASGSRARCFCRLWIRFPPSGSIRRSRRCSRSEGTTCSTRSGGSRERARPARPSSTSGLGDRKRGDAHAG